MAKISIKKEIFEQARDRSTLSEDERIMLDLILEQAGKGRSARTPPTCRWRSCVPCSTTPG